MITKAFKVDTLWKSEMYKSGHIPISIKNELKNDDICNTCYKRNDLISNHFNESYFINRLAIKYSDYSSKYWEGVKKRQEIYRLKRTL